MRWRPFVLALLVPLLLTGAALLSASRNRVTGRGPTTLSEREVYVSPRNADDTAASLWLSWHPPPDPAWPGRERLAQLGFDTTVDPAADAAADHYARTLPREVFVAMELDGPAFLNVLERLERDGLTPPARGVGDDLRRRGSRLVVVDVDRDKAVLARRYPDARTHLITAATIRPFLMDRTPASAPVVSASIADIDPRQIHVPSEWAGQLPTQDEARAATPQPFVVDLYYGGAGEPWVAGIRRR